MRDGAPPEVRLTTLGIFIGFAATAALLRFLPDRRAFDHPRIVPALAGLGAVLALFLDAAATGWLPLDALLRAGVVAGAVVAGAGERRWPARWAIGVAAVALVVFASSSWGMAATIGAGALVAMAAIDRHERVVQGAAAGAAALALLSLRWELFTGAPGVLAAVALAPLVVLAVAAAYRFRPRVVVRVAAGAVAFAIVGGVVGLAAAALARHTVDQGVTSARAGLAALGSDDRDGARLALDDAERSFHDAHGTLRAFWARPAFAVPFVAQQIRAVSTLASAGGDLAGTASSALAIADPRTIKPEGGQVDLEAVKGLQEPLAEVLDVLERSDRDLRHADSPWLLSPVRTRHDELSSKVRDARKQADVAARAAAVAPDMLGANGLRTYLLAVYTPAESRGSGGFMGNYGELTAEGGKLTLAKFGRIKELTEGGADPASRRIAGQKDFVASWGSLRPDHYWGLINFTNDFPTAASVMRQLYPQSGGRKVDGVIAVDPDAFAALLRLTGPLTVPGLAEPLTPDNARRMLLHDQYVALEESNRVDFLGDASRLLFDRLTTGSLPGVGAMAGELGPVVRGRHLQLESAHRDEQQLFEAIGATGAVAPLAEGADSIGFTGQNYGGNKIDWFLQRTSTYEAHWNPGNGAVTSELTIELRNDAPATGEPHSVIGWGGDEILGQIPVADGENLMLLSIYSALPPGDLTIDGTPAKAVRGGRELGRYATRVYVRVPPQSTSTVKLSFAGRVDRGRTYELGALHQPMVNPDKVTARVVPTDGWRTVGASGTATWQLDGPAHARVEACPLSPTLSDRLRGGC